MKKAATILLWISFGIDIIYLVAAIVGAFLGGAMNPAGTTDGMIYGIVILYQLFRCGVPMIIKLLLMLVIIFSMKRQGERIITEVITIVLFSGVGGFLTIGINYLGNFLISRLGDTSYIGFLQANSIAGWAGPLHTVSNTLLILAVAFAIAYKKCELTDLSRILKEEDV